MRRYSSIECALTPARPWRDPCSQAGVRCSLSRTRFGSSDIVDDIEPRAGFAEVQFDRSGVADHAHGTVDDILQNRFQTPAAHLLDFDGSQMCADEHFLSERTQQVEGEHAAEQYDFVDAEFAGGELLTVQADQAAPA